MKNILYVGLLLLLTSCSAQSSEQLNTQGYYLLIDGKYEESIEKFKAAISKNNKNDFAWYNLACAYSLYVQHFNLLEKVKEEPLYIVLKKIDTYIADSNSALKNAILINEVWRGKALNDIDLEQLRKNVIFYETIGYDLKSEKDAFIVILNTRKYYAQPADVVSIDIDFISNNKVRISSFAYYEKDMHEVEGEWYIFRKDNAIKIKIIFAPNGYGLTECDLDFFTNNSIKVDKNIVPLKNQGNFQVNFVNTNTYLTPYFYNDLFQ